MGMDSKHTVSTVETALSTTNESTDCPPGACRIGKKLRYPMQTRRIKMRVDRDMAKVPERVREKMRNCINGKEPWPLVLMGDPGVGKSCAALSFGDFIAGYVWFCEFQEFCNDLRLAQRGELDNGRTKETEMMVWNRFRRQHLVILDDVGNAEPSHFRTQTLLSCLNFRENMPLIVTSNLNLTQIANLYDQRIASRLSGGTPVWMDGDDQRLRRN